jgi:hypothetical protein
VGVEDELLNWKLFVMQNVEIKKLVRAVFIEGIELMNIQISFGEIQNVAALN